MPAMTEDTLSCSIFQPSSAGRSLSIPRTSGLIRQRAGPVAAGERWLGRAPELASCIRNWHYPERVVHTLPAMQPFRMFTIACGRACLC